MNRLLKTLIINSLVLTVLVIIGCDVDSYEATKITKKDTPKAIKVKLLGPGERGNYFQVTSQNVSLGGMCFEAKINGVEGRGKLINGPEHIYNIFVYFHNRHSPKKDWKALEAIKGNQVVPVKFDVSKCSRYGFYDPSKHVAKFNADVNVIPAPR